MKRNVILICIFLIFCGGCAKKVDTKEFLTLPIFRDNIKDGKFYYQGKDDDMLVICTRTLSCHDWEGFDYYAGAHSKCYDVMEKDIKSSISDYRKYLPKSNLILSTPRELPDIEVTIDEFKKLLTERFVEIPAIFEFHDSSTIEEYTKFYRYSYIDHEIEKTRTYAVTYVEEGKFIKISDMYKEENSYTQVKDLSFTFFYAQ